MEKATLIPKKIKIFLLKIFYKKKYDCLTFGSNITLDRNIIFGGFNYLYDGVNLKYSTVDRYTYISKHSTIAHTKIGRFCSIGENVRTYLGRHPISGFVSTHPVFYSTIKQCGISFVDKNLFDEHVYLDAEKKTVVEIGNDVWIGNNVSIMDGVRIGDGAVIAINSVVTKDIEPYGIYGGTPAKLIRYRFNEKQRNILLNLKWWDNDDVWVREHAAKFQNLERFLENK